jgi:hypothetical protein
MPEPGARRQCGRAVRQRHALLRCPSPAIRTVPGLDSKKSLLAWPLAISARCLHASAVPRAPQGPAISSESSSVPLTQCAYISPAPSPCTGLNSIPEVRIIRAEEASPSPFCVFSARPGATAGPQFAFSEERMEGAESCGRRRPRAPKASIGCLGVPKISRGLLGACFVPRKSLAPLQPRRRCIDGEMSYDWVWLSLRDQSMPCVLVVSRHGLSFHGGVEWTGPFDHGMGCYRLTSFVVVGPLLGLQ